MSTPRALDAQILQCFATSNFPPGWEQKYLPEGCLDRLITRESIIREFAKDDDPDEERHVHEDLINFILKSAKKVLAISLWSCVESNQLHKAMKIFKSTAFTDSRLPIHTLNSSELPWSKLGWGVAKLDSFEHHQWKFLVPIFSEEHIKLELDSRHILPFAMVPRKPMGGAFSEVYEVTIHESHQEKPMQKPDGSSANAAIKSIKPSATTQSEAEAIKEWEREERALEETRGLHHPHIIEVKSIFTWKGKGRFFMFPWADGGSLRDLYASSSRPALDNALIQEIIQQLKGLAHAIDRLHNWGKKDNKDAGSYRHGDLKPENILRFEDNTRIGILKIADMGLARHHFDETGLRGPTTTRYSTPLYEPPEAFSNPKNARSRQYDIWSMGCVILEVIVWLLYGNDELERFNTSMSQPFGNSSPYWALDEASDTVKVHPNVQACLNFIGKDPECKGSTAIGDLLDIVKTKLIVIPLPPSPGKHNTQKRAGEGSSHSTAHPSGNFRAKAKEFDDALGVILEKGRSNDKYWLTDTPRSNLPGPVDSMPYVPMASSSNGRAVPTIKAQDEATIKAREAGGVGANERQDVSGTSDNHHSADKA